jgi:hypothetical protein
MKWYARLANSLLRGISGAMKPSYGTRSYTDSGEYVKSKGEKIIADWLRAHGFKYEYEKKLVIKRPMRKDLWYSPDFYLPDYNIYIEYLGMYENFGDYRRKNDKKMEDYKKAGVNCLYIFPDNLCDLDSVIKPWLT